MSKKIDKEMIRILQQEIRNVIGNRHMTNDERQAKVEQLEAQINELQN